MIQKLVMCFFDTGIEMKATKKHLEYLEKRYNIDIIRIRSEITVPIAVRKFGYPFISKDISSHIDNLQSHGFNFTSITEEEFKKLYPTVKSIKDWWFHNKYSNNISKRLKNFLINNPPNFKISSKCCYYAKKRESVKFIRNNNFDLVILGLRQNEGGCEVCKTRMY